MRLSAVFVPLAFLLFSCAGNLRPELAPDADLSAVLAKAKSARSGFSSIKARARVSIKSPEASMVFDQVATVTRAGLLNVAIFAPFGEMLAKVVSDGKTVRMKTNWEELVFEDAADFSLSYLYPGLPPHLGVPDMVNFLLGGSPFAIPDEGFSARVSESEVVFVFAGKPPFEVTVDPRRNFITGIRGNFSSGERAQISFSMPKAVAPDVYFPRRLLLETAGYSLSVDYDENFKLGPRADVSSPRAAEGR